MTARYSVQFTIVPFQVPICPCECLSVTKVIKNIIQTTNKCKIRLLFGGSLLSAHMFLHVAIIILRSLSVTTTNPLTSLTSQMSHKVFHHKVPAFTRHGFKHITIDQKKSRSTWVLHTTVANSPSLRKTTTPVAVTASTTKVDALRDDTNVNEHTPLWFSKVNYIRVISHFFKANWLSTPSPQMISFGSRQHKCPYGSKT